MSGNKMTEDRMRDLVKECGLNWRHGYMPLFDGDPTNRYAVLIEAAVAAERYRMNQHAVTRPKPDDRPCTCHPEDNPPQPCVKRYALADCKAAHAAVA